MDLASTRVISFSIIQSSKNTQNVKNKNGETRFEITMAFDSLSVYFIFDFLAAPWHDRLNIQHTGEIEYNIYNQISNSMNNHALKILSSD